MTSVSDTSSVSSDVPTVSTTTVVFPPTDYRDRSGTVASFNQPGVLVPEYTFALPSPSRFVDREPSLSNPQLHPSLAQSITSRTRSSVYSRTSALTSRLSRGLIRGIGGQPGHDDARSARSPSSPPGSPRRNAHRFGQKKPYLRLGPTSPLVRVRTKKMLMAVLKHVLVVVVVAPASFMLKTTTNTIMVTKTRMRRSTWARAEEMELVVGPQVPRSRPQPHTPLLEAFFAPSSSTHSTIPCPLSLPVVSLTPEQQEELIETKRMFSQEKALQVLGEEALESAVRSVEGYTLTWLEAVERERGDRILECVPRF
ncbi:hypothetical protein AAF712_014930 [Marasmius tenuissimus]|uniref:Uncharacterized protein n=1 Tax=Marasmius tenuissimus TaxID=585030 RepID=A0ABR2Z9Y0_9AGAR